MSNHTPIQLRANLKRFSDNRSASNNNKNMDNFNFERFNPSLAKNLAFEIYDDGKGNDVSHDDGFMHVSHGTTRYSFDIGQEVSKGEYNRQANSILSQIGVEGEVTGRNN